MIKKRLIAVLSVLSFPLTAIAIPPPQEDFGAHNINELGLNAVQTATVSAVFNDQQDKLKAVHEETRARLQTILTPEQMTKLDELHQHSRHRLSDDGTGNGSAAP